MIFTLSEQISYWAEHSRKCRNQDLNKELCEVQNRDQKNDKIIQ